MREEIRRITLRNHQLEELLAIHKLWLKHQGKLFPTECGGKSVAEVDLVSLDSYTAGCVSVFLERGKLDKKRRAVLQRCEQDLDAASEALDGYAGIYYRQLKKLASAVLGYTDKHGLEAPAT